MPETSLALIETLTAEVFIPGTIDPLLAKIKAEVRAAAASLDISTPFNRSELASLAYKIARSKTGIDNLRKSVVANEKKRLAKIDAEGKRIWDELESLQLEVRKPLTDWENADKARIAALEEGIAEVTTAAEYTLRSWTTLSVEAMRDRLKELESDPRDWQEFEAKHNVAMAQARNQFGEAIAKREAYDKEQAELARLRKEAAEREQKEREERLVREATEKAERAKLEAEAREKAAAERHAYELKAAAEKAEAARIQAVKDEQARVERENASLKAQTEAREKDKEHRKNVNSNALAAFVKAGLTHEAAKLAVSAIVKGDIPRVVLSY